MIAVALVVGVVVSHFRLGTAARLIHPAPIGCPAGSAQSRHIMGVLLAPVGIFVLRNTTAKAR